LIYRVLFTVSCTCAFSVGGDRLTSSSHSAFLSFETASAIAGVLVDLAQGIAHPMLIAI
jgi:hypothetical protein